MGTKKFKMDVNSLRRGDLVVAIRHLDPVAADVAPGTLGVVFEETDAYGDGCGPMVRWFNGGACNVYNKDVAYTEDAEVILNDNPTFNYRLARRKATQTPEETPC